MKNPSDSKKAMWAWCFYDWANSVFALTVMAAFFPGFFKGYWSAGVDTAISTARLGFGSAIAGLAVALLSPLAGSLMPAFENPKKKQLLFWAVTGAAFTAILFVVPKGEWLWALTVYIVARMGFSLANLFYDALLVDVSTAQNRHIISSLGYALGYLGCGILFVINLMMYKTPSAFGLASGGEAVRFSFPLAALWWVMFSIPMAVYVKEQRPAPLSAKQRQSVFNGLKILKSTGRDIFGRRETGLFLLAYWFYIDGMHTIVMMATDYGLSIGLSLSALMTALLVVQLVAFPSAIGAGFLTRKIGAQNTILMAIGVYICIAIGGGWVMRTDTHFIMFAGLTGVVQGAIQALSRSLFTTMIPAGKEAPYFGFYNMVGRFAVILGPAIVGGCNLLLHRLGMPSHIAARTGFSMLALLFVAGGVLLLRLRPAPEKVHLPETDPRDVPAS
ncbi:MAG: MFS transporter [Deltaproteobacteria bacterium]|nr:MFS transporter [Deltaproteobacteria bacterium]